MVRFCDQHQRYCVDSPAVASQTTTHCLFVEHCRRLQVRHIAATLPCHTRVVLCISIPASLCAPLSCRLTSLCRMLQVKRDGQSTKDLDFEQLILSGSLAGVINVVACSPFEVRNIPTSHLPTPHGSNAVCFTRFTASVKCATKDSDWTQAAVIDDPHHRIWGSLLTAALSSRRHVGCQG